MSPTAALASEVVRIYLILVAAMLVVAGAVLAALRWGLRRNVGHAWNAYRGWLVMVPLVVGAIFLGRAATICFVTLVSLFGFKEYARATGIYRDWAMTALVYLGIVAVGVVSLVPDPRLDRPGWYGLFAILPAYVMAAILLVPIVRNRAEGQLQTIALALLGFLYIGWMLGHASYLANANHAYGYLLYLIFAVELNDVAAFTCGKLFGRHPLRSNISPNKTWEGALGGAGRLPGAAVAHAVLVSAFRHGGTRAHGADRGHRRPTGRSLDQRHQARPGRQRHGRRLGGPRRHPGSRG